MHVIYKYQLNEPRNVIVADERARFIHVGKDAEGLACVWAIVDPDAPAKSHTLVIVGTGDPCLDPEQHIYHGTWVNKPYVWHLFSEEPKKVKRGKLLEVS